MSKAQEFGSAADNVRVNAGNRRREARLKIAQTLLSRASHGAPDMEEMLADAAERVGTSTDEAAGVFWELVRMGYLDDSGRLPIATAQH